MINSENSDALVKIINGTMSKLDYFDEKQLLKLIELHNIPGRIIECIKKNELDNFFSENFMLELYKLYDEFLDAVHRNIDAVGEVLIEFEDGKNNYPIIIKGFSNYVLSKNERVIRKGDIDILPSDVTDFISILLRKGYRLTKEPFMHEAGEYSKNNIEFDLHLFFPVYRYDEKILGLQDIKNTFIEMPFEKLDYSILRTNSVESPDKAGLLVADANMMIIIICSHAFMNYTNIWSISHREKTYIKIGELWDIFDLVNHVSYSSQKFCEYVERFSAEDCVTWTCTILKEIFKNNPLPYQGVDFELLNIRYPKCLWWNLWDYLPTSRMQLLSDDWYDIRGVFACIGSNKVPLNSKKKASELGKVYLIGDIDIVFIIKNNRLIIEKNNGCFDGTSNYRIDFGNAAIEINICDNIFEIGSSSSKMAVSNTASEISIELVNNLLLLCHRRVENGVNEIVVPIEIKED